MKMGELFAGYGGLGLAVESVFGAEPVWFSEFEEAPSKVLSFHWPVVPNLGDITTIDWENAPDVDIISGGSPCQDLALSGKRQGMTAGTRSNLWVNMREAIAIKKPSYVVWENVRGAYSGKSASEMDNVSSGTNLRALGRVLGDLNDLGYDARWRGVKASDAGAPHNRFRVFLLARRRSGPVPVAGKGTVFPKPVGEWTAPAHDAFLDKYTSKVSHWEKVRGLEYPHPAVINPKTGKYRLNPEFPEWMMGLDPGWVTAVPGLSYKDMMKMLGNGVVRHQAALALKTMLDEYASDDVIGDKPLNQPQEAGFACWDSLSDVWRVTEGLEETEAVYRKPWPLNGSLVNGTVFETESISGSFEESQPDTGQLLPTPITRDWKDSNVSVYKALKIQSRGHGIYLPEAVAFALGDWLPD